jgi:O-acetyl-ADP-ribose deacetylase (regulator of RNase III)
MSLSKSINQSTLKLVKGDITDMEVEAFVYYAQSDLKLGAGFGNAIAMRGGPSVQKALDEVGSLELGESVITEAGNMKASYIIHAVGPKFMEAETPAKLKKTILNALNEAEKKGIKKVAFPPMGTGFYCVPLPMSAEVMIDTIKEYFTNHTEIDEVIICPLDNRESRPFIKKLETIT